MAEGLKGLRIYRLAEMLADVVWNESPDCRVARLPGCSIA